MLNLINFPSNKAQSHELEMMGFFPNIDDFIDSSIEEVGGIILDALCKRQNPQTNVGLSISFIKYHHPVLLQSPAQETKKTLELKISEAWNWLSREGYIMVDPTQVDRVIQDSYIVVTEKGRECAKNSDVSSFITFNNYSWDFLHPIIKGAAAPPFRSGKYSSAVFESFKQVEVSIKEVMPDQKSCGKNLIDAFYKHVKDMCSSTQEPAYLEKFRDMAKSAFGYRNDDAHNNATECPKMAFHKIALASLLIYEVNTIQKTFRQSGKSA